MEQIESLFAYAILRAFGLFSDKNYNEILDSCFLKYPDSQLLLKLEEVSGDYKESFSILNHFFYYETKNIDYIAFGKALFNGLKSAYNSNRISLQAFGRKCFSIWSLLPETIKNIEPYFTLNYADDPLSWGDEKQSRDLYEKAFSFYEEVIE